MSHPELKAEQAYVDRAYAYLERMRETVLRAGDAADGEVAQAALDAWAANAATASTYRAEWLYRHNAARRSRAAPDARR